MIDVNSLEGKIQAAVKDFLKDPTAYPDELKAWLPRFLEINPPAFQIQDIQGLYTMQSTIVLLGAKINGRIGMIRAGSAPYDYLRTTYDSVYEKWVSDPIVVIGSAEFSTVSTSATIITSAPAPQLIWRNFKTAGLMPQIRAVGVVTAPAATTASVSLRVAGWDAGGSSGSSDSIMNLFYVTAATSQLDSGWVNVTTPVTVYDFLTMTAYMVSSSGSSVTLTNFAVNLRWVTLSATGTCSAIALAYTCATVVSTFATCSDLAYSGV